MNRIARVALSLLLAGVLALSASLPVANTPEQVGLSKERLGRIHDVMQSHIASHDIPGAVTLVMRNGRVAHLETHGLMDVESNKPMAKDTIFRVWSMSKVVTGAAIMMLMEDGKVRLNDPVSRFVPEFKGLKVAVIQEPAGGAPPAAAGAGQRGADQVDYYTIPATREITIQDLLTHVSGLGSGRASNAAIRKNGDRPGKTLAEYIPLWGSTPLDFQPGSKWTYSPLAAFDTLGRVVEVASGMTFDQFLRQRLFEPLGIKEMFFVPNDSHTGRIPTTYHREANAMKRTTAIDKLFDPTYFSGGGGLYATAEEYAKFGEMLSEGGQLNGKRVLSPKTVELMSSAFAPDTLTGRQPGRAFGLSVQVVTDPIAAGMRVSKGSYGWDGAYGTHFWVDPKEKVVGLMMIAVDNPNRQLDRDYENAVMQAIIE
jgi:CubicO group peptidase (beta-lactamase class C family)